MVCAPGENRCAASGLLKTSGCRSGFEPWIAPRSARQSPGAGTAVAFTTTHSPFRAPTVATVPRTGVAWVARSHAFAAGAVMVTRGGGGGCVVKVTLLVALCPHRSNTVTEAVLAPATCALSARRTSKLESGSSSAVSRHSEWCAMAGALKR